MPQRESTYLVHALRDWKQSGVGKRKIRVDIFEGIEDEMIAFHDGSPHLCVRRILRPVLDPEGHLGNLRRCVTSLL